MAVLASRLMLARTILFLLAITVLAHVLGATVLPTTMWGVHLYTFFSPIVLAVATAAVIAGTGMVLLSERARERVAAWATTPSRLPPWGIPLSVVLVSVPLFWLARAGHTYLGDGTSLSTDIPAGVTFHPRQPLTMLLQHEIYQHLAPWLGGGERPDVLVAEDALAWGSVLAGAFFAGMVWLLAGELSRLGARTQADRGAPQRLRLVVTLVLLGQGTVQLFFGYVENYAFHTVALTLYLWLALRLLRGRGSLLLPGLALLLAMALHLAAAILLPSFVALSVWGLAKPATRRRAVLDLAGLAVITAGVQVAMRSLNDNYDLLGTMISVGAIALTGQQEHDSGYLLSQVHVRDFFNEQMLIGPLGLFLFVPSVLVTLWRRTRWDPSLVFLFVAASAMLGASWLAGDSNLGYARNWDLLAPGGLVLTAAGLGFLFLAQPTRRELAPALIGALLISAYHTVPWIATNASFDRSFHRLKLLPLGKGRTEMLVGKWYIRQNDLDEAERWLVEATKVNPANNNAYYILGVLELERGQAEAAATSLSKAVALRPDKVDFRSKLVEALLALGRDEDALPHLAVLTERSPTVQRWMDYGNALRAVGRPAEARHAFGQALHLHEEALRDDPEGFETNLRHGIMLANLGELDAAVPHLAKALEADPDSDVALFYAGYTLLLLDRRDEAEVLLRRCLELNPGHPNRAQIDGWLGTEDGRGP